MTFHDVPHGLGVALSWALNMDEEAQVREKYGATFYSSVEECQYLPTTVEEGKALYEPFEKLLEKHMTIQADTQGRTVPDDAEYSASDGGDNGGGKENYGTF